MGVVARERGERGGRLGTGACTTSETPLVSIADVVAIYGNAYDTQTVRDGLPSLNAEMVRGGITTAARISAFLATLRNESGLRYNAVQGGTATYRGRGFIQVTGRSNYTTYGNRLGVDLVGNPDLALDPDIASRIFADYFINHVVQWPRGTGPLVNCVDLARARDWRGVRFAVNGGFNGLDRFLAMVNGLLALTD